MPLWTWKLNFIYSLPEILEKLFRLIRTNKKFNWVIKLHRKDTIDNFKQALDISDFSDYNIIDTNHFLYDKNIYDWFNHCNLLITGNSSTSVENAFSISHYSRFR